MHDRVASTPHTALLVVGLLIVAVRAAMTQPMTRWPTSLSEPGARVALYVSTAALQLLCTAYVWFGVRRSGGLRRLVDEAPWTVTRWLRYAATGFAGLLSWLAFQAALGLILRPSREQVEGVVAMLPHTSAERLVWVGFAISVALCEEIIYRGYLMRQLAACSRSWWVAVLLQAALYGCGHLVLPPEMAVGVALLGVLLGLIAWWQKSLVPGMILHAGTALMPILVSFAGGAGEGSL